MMQIETIVCYRICRKFMQHAVRQRIRHVRLASSLKIAMNCRYHRRYSTKVTGIVLGIETSCDDTGCAIVDSNGKILGEALNSQQQIHLNNGGIIPPIARDLHRQHIEHVVHDALRAANIELSDVDAIATTVKPGLPLSLVVGMNYGKHLSRTSGKPLIPIHHMEAHALTIRMVQKAARRLKLRNLPEFRPLSGGRAIELAASKSTDPQAFEFPMVMSHYRDCNFSVAGIKNTVRRHILQQEKLHGVEGDELIPDVFNLCASIQMAITRHLCQRLQRGMEFVALHSLLPRDNKTLVVSGGVACNKFIKRAMGLVCQHMGYSLAVPPPHLCTDNGIMIAWNGIERLHADIGVTHDLDSVDIASKCPLGEDWTDKVAEASIKCKWIKLTPLLKEDSTSED